MTGGDGLYLGADVGTAATRVSLVRPDGTAVVASAGYWTVRGGDGRVEQDPAAWSRALATALRRLRLSEGRHGEGGVDLRAVTAVGFSSPRSPMPPCSGRCTGAASPTLAAR